MSEEVGDEKKGVMTNIKQKDNTEPTKGRQRSEYERRKWYNSERNRDE
jgi:hypothetical protein